MLLLIICRLKGIRRKTIKFDALKNYMLLMSEKELRKPSEQITKTLARNLLAFRRERQISQAELAELCNLHRTYIGSIERGERNVTLSTLEVLAQAIGVSVPALLTPTKHDNRTDT